MARIGGKWVVILRPVVSVVWSFLLASIFVSAERSLRTENSASTHNATVDSGSDNFSKLLNLLWQADESGYNHVWPVSFKTILGKVKLLCFSFSFSFLFLIKSCLRKNYTLHYFFFTSNYYY